MELKLNGKIDLITLLLIIVLILIFGIFYFYHNFKFEDHKSGSIALNSEEQMVFNPIPQTIQKTEEVLTAEEEVKISRDVKLNKDGSFTIIARLKNLSNIPNDVVLNDFHEVIKFEKHVNILNGNVVAMNGSLFPGGDKITVSSYGPGPKSEKSTSINITLLDLNFDLKTKNTDLYELHFVPDVSVSELTFGVAEIRSGKFILEFKEEKIEP